MTKERGEARAAATAATGIAPWIVEHHSAWDAAGSSGNDTRSTKDG